MIFSSENIIIHIKVIIKFIALFLFTFMIKKTPKMVDTKEKQNKYKYKRNV